MNELIINNQYAIDDLKKTIKVKQEESNNVLDKMAIVIRDLSVAEELTQDEEKDFRFVVNMSEDIKTAIKKGEIKLDYNKKTGELYAQLRENNKFGKKLSISEEVIEAGLEPSEVADAAQLQMIAEQLEKVVETLESIGEGVISILQGQENDRIAMYYSGQNLYLESRNIQDESLKKFIIAQAVQSLSEANAKMVQQVKADIKFLVEKQHIRQKGKSVKAINETVKSINKAFEIIYHSAVMKAGIYYENAEIPAMLTVMDEFGQFLNQLIIPYVPKLIEYDENISYFRGSVWEQRIDTLLEMDTLKNNLLNGTVNYIEAKENCDG